MKLASYCLCAVLFGALVSGDSASAADPAFQTWLQSLWPQAQSLGVSRATFDMATRGLEPDLSLPELVLPGRPERPPPGQPEFVQTPADYLKEASIERARGGRPQALDQYRAPLDCHRAPIRRAADVLLAIFGRETDYGRRTDTLQRHPRAWRRKPISASARISSAKNSCWR